MMSLTAEQEVMVAPYTLIAAQAMHGKLRDLCPHSVWHVCLLPQMKSHRNILTVTLSICSPSDEIGSVFTQAPDSLQDAARRRPLCNSLGALLKRVSAIEDTLRESHVLWCWAASHTNGGCS